MSASTALKHMEMKNGGDDLVGCWTSKKHLRGVIYGSETCKYLPPKFLLGMLFYKKWFAEIIIMICYESSWWIYHHLSWYLWTYLTTSSQIQTFKIKISETLLHAVRFSYGCGWFRFCPHVFARQLSLQLRPGPCFLDSDPAFPRTPRSHFQVL